MCNHTYSKSMDQPGMVVNPARGQLSRGTEYFPVPVNLMLTYDALQVPRTTALISTTFGAAAAQLDRTPTSPGNMSLTYDMIPTDSGGFSTCAVR